MTFFITSEVEVVWQTPMVIFFVSVIFVTVCLKQAITAPKNLFLTLAGQWFEKSIKTKPIVCALNDLGMLYSARKDRQQNKVKAERFLNQAAAKLLKNEPDLLLQNNMLALEKKYSKYAVTTAEDMSKKDSSRLLALFILIT